MRLFVNLVTVTTLATFSLPLSAQSFSVHGDGNTDVFLPRPLTEGTWDIELTRNSRNDTAFLFWLRGTTPRLGAIFSGSRRITRTTIAACWWSWCHIVPENPGLVRSKLWIEPFLFDGRWTITFTKQGSDPDPEPPPPIYGPCTPTTDVLQFTGGYSVRMCWQASDGRTGQAKAGLWASGESGLLWFFERDNAEALVKVLDGCPINGYRWVFVAPVTDLGLSLRVTGPTGQTWDYTNSVGVTAPSRSDTNAFRCQ